jgi:hypothetical protein
VTTIFVFGLQLIKFRATNFLSAEHFASEDPGHTSFACHVESVFDAFLGAHLSDALLLGLMLVHRESGHPVPRCGQRTHLRRRFLT